MDRRKFLHKLSLTSGVAAGSVIISACSSTTAQENTIDFADDAELVIAGAEFEAMGIKTYQVAAASNLITDNTVLNTAVAFMNDHIEHLTVLNELLSNFGFDKIDPTNADPDPGVANVTSQTDVLELAHSVEYQAAVFYFTGIVNQITSPEARRVFANILPVETAHFITYKNALGFQPAIDGAIFENLTSGLDIV